MSKRELPQVVTDLQAVRDRLTPPDMWQQGSYGGEEGPNCIIGAIRVVTQQLFGRQFNARVAISNANIRRPIIGFNDNHTHKEVLALIDTAIKTEKTKAGVVEYV